MVTNGAQSFVIFLYADDGIQWTTGDASGGSGGIGGTPAQVGFNAGDGNRTATVPASRTADIINIEVTSNVGVPGMWVFQVDQDKVEFGGCSKDSESKWTIHFPSPGSCARDIQHCLTQCMIPFDNVMYIVMKPLLSIPFCKQAQIGTAVLW